MVDSTWYPGVSNVLYTIVAVIVELVALASLVLSIMLTSILIRRRYTTSYYTHAFWFAVSSLLRLPKLNTNVIVCLVCECTSVST